jgi:hypothetical protein
VIGEMENVVAKRVEENVLDDIMRDDDDFEPEESTSSSSTFTAKNDDNGGGTSIKDENSTTSQKDSTKDGREVNGLSSTRDDKNGSGKKRPRRYFVIKSFTHKHLELSIEKSIWSTQTHNESKLNEAFEVS